MSDRCERCGRPAWVRHGGMGGGLHPDAETTCVQPGGMWCRVAAEGRRAGMREALVVASELLPTVDLSDVDAEIAKRCGDG